MQDVQVTFTDGPLRGRDYEFEVGKVVIGRLPGEGGLELKGADSSVSRAHAELVERGGEIELRNLSPNGTTVNGKIVLETITIESGAMISIGPDHHFSVEWRSFGGVAPSYNEDLKPKAPKKKGPLSSPIVRAVIGVYLIGLLGLGVWLSTLDSSSGVAPDDWPDLSVSYDSYQPDGLSDEVKTRRAGRAQQLVQDLRVLKTQKREREIGRVCREIMALDKDPKSPLYQYGARCLGSP